MDWIRPSLTTPISSNTPPLHGSSLLQQPLDLMKGSKSTTLLLCHLFRWVNQFQKRMDFTQKSAKDLLGFFVFQRINLLLSTSSCPEDPTDSWFHCLHLAGLWVANGKCASAVYSNWYWPMWAVPNEKWTNKNKKYMKYIEIHRYKYPCGTINYTQAYSIDLLFEH